jgi:hypothetical protein
MEDCLEYSLENKKNKDKCRNEIFTRTYER